MPCLPPCFHDKSLAEKDFPSFRRSSGARPRYLWLIYRARSFEQDASLLKENVNKSRKHHDVPRSDQHQQDRITREMCARSELRGADRTRPARSRRHDQGAAEKICALDQTTVPSMATGEAHLSRLYRRNGEIL